jgi:YegS/Rv2252/BmrU family lipid kinase
MKVVAIINPISGAGADASVAEHRTALLTAELERRGLHADIHLTTHGGHAHALARAAVEQQAELVVVWGGDGTVNETGAALLGTRVAMGLIPAGSGNGLAAALRCPRESHAAIAAALDGSVRAIDAGVLAGRPFFNIAGLGIDARIARLFNVRARGARGKWPYVFIGIREGCRYCGQRYEIDLDGDRQSVRALLIGFANGGEYGNGVRLSAHARLDDGLLDAMVVEDRPVIARFWDARHLAAGTADRAPRVVARQIRRAVVQSSEPLEYHVDGEPGTTEGEVEVTIRPKALLIKGS